MFKPKTILLIDPDLRTQDEFSRLLSQDGCDVERASRISDAIKRIRKVRFDCIIIDQDLPDMEGCEAIPIIRTLDPNVHIIMTALVNTKQLESKIRQQDVFYYYIKSFDRKELRAAVQNAFRRPQRDPNTEKGKTRTDAQAQPRPQVTPSPASRDASREEAVEMQKEKNKEKNILIVDDDPDFVDATRRILEDASYRVQTALSGDEALEALDASVPDLIILDIMMQKGADGIILSRRFKKDERLNKVPILVLTSITEQTGFSFIGEPRHPRFFPVEEFMEKPVPAQELLAKIDEMLSKPRA